MNSTVLERLSTAALLLVVGLVLLLAAHGAYAQTGLVLVAGGAGHLLPSAPFQRLGTTPITADNEVPISTEKIDPPAPPPLPPAPGGGAR